MYDSLDNIEAALPDFPKFITSNFWADAAVKFLIFTFYYLSKCYCKSEGYEKICGSDKPVPSVMLSPIVIILKVLFPFNFIEHPISYGFAYGLD